MIAVSCISGVGLILSIVLTSKGSLGRWEGPGWVAFFVLFAGAILTRFPEGLDDSAVALAKVIGPTAIDERASVATLTQNALLKENRRTGMPQPVLRFS